MSKTVMTVTTLARAALLAGAMALGAPAFAAEPSIHDVYVAAEAGKFAEAQKMMDEVLLAHPKSGTAHFVEAEVLAKQGKFAEARAALATAEKLAPGLPKVKPAAVDSLRALLASGTAAPKAGYAQQAPARDAGYASGGYNNNGAASSGMPWGMILILGAGLVGFIVLASRFMARRQGQQPAYDPAGFSPAGVPPGYAPGGGYPQQGYGPGNGPGYGPGYGGGQPGQPGMGSRIVGGLATGAAVGAGIVAGEALMHRFTDGNRDQGGHDQPRNDIVYDDPASSERLRNDDMGGSDFGVSGGSWDDGGSGGGGGDSGDDWN